MNKMKIEIKNRWTGDILFEYEKENNTLKDTLEKAIKEGANLVGANLVGADLRKANLVGANLAGANLRGADLSWACLIGTNLREVDIRGTILKKAQLQGMYLYMWDGGDIDIEKIISNFENKLNIKIKSYYINKHVLYPVSLNYWKNGLIIDDYEIVDPQEEVKEMTIEEIQKILGYRVKIVEESDKYE